MISIRFPNITGGTVADQLAQTRAYLYDMAEQLNIALTQIDQRQSAGETAILQEVRAATSGERAESNFNEIKSLIIKSADIVNAYTIAISRELSGVYVAQSDFNIYQKETSQKITETESGLSQEISQREAITNQLTGEIEALRQTEGYIKAGIDEDGIVRIEVGQETNDGFKAFARFTPTELSFYDEGGNKVAYISNNKLEITNARISGALELGGYKLTTQQGIAFTWIGG